MTEKQVIKELLFSHLVTSDSLWPRGLQLARLPCPSPSPGACSNSCPLNQWWHPTISSSVVPFSSCPQSFPASGSFPMSQLFASGGQSFSFSIRPSNEYSYYKRVEKSLLQRTFSRKCWQCVTYIYVYININIQNILYSICVCVKIYGMGDDMVFQKNYYSNLK